MTAELRAAITASAWPRALELAIARWREHRAVEAAALVDAIAARCPRIRVERRRVHPAWIALAASYDPLAVPALVDAGSRQLDHAVAWHDLRTRHGDTARFAALERVATRMLAGNDLAIVERFLLVADWPADPRAAALLVRWLTDLAPRWDDAEAEALYRLIGAHLIALGDSRVRRELERAETAEHWYGLARDAIRRAAGAALRGLPEPPPDPITAELREALPQPPTPHADLAPLWAQVADHPDDDGPRLVLADALVLRGDPRGELIALQLAPAPNASAIARANRLVKLHWRSWLGGLAFAIERRGSEFRRGWLATATTVAGRIPRATLAEVRGHLAIAVVDTVRSHGTEPHDYAHFVASLDHPLARLGVAADMAHAFALVAPRWTPRTLEVTGDAADAERFARMMPDAVIELK